MCVIISCRTIEYNKTSSAIIWEKISPNVSLDNVVTEISGVDGNRRILL